MGITKLRLPTGISRDQIMKLLDKEYWSNKKRKRIPYRVVAVTFSLLFGRRLGEIALLDWKDVDRNSRRISWHILKKRDRNYIATLPMGQLGYKYLRLWWIKQGMPSKGRVVPGSPKAWSNNFRRWAKRHKLKLNFHKARHLFAIHLIETGTPLPLVQKALQHSDLRITSIYLQLFAEDLRDVMP